jgi:hypothetical protein
MIRPLVREVENMDHEEPHGAAETDSTIPGTFTIVHFGKDDCDGILRKQLDSPVDFVCLTIGGAPSREGSFPNTESAVKWAKQFRACEATDLAGRTKQAAGGRLAGIGPPPACILAVVDRIEPTVEDSGEFEVRETLVQEGVILVQRPRARTARATDDELIGRFIRGALATVQHQVTVPTASATAPTSSFFNWPVSPPPEEAEMYGRETANAPLPASKNELEERFKHSYWPDGPAHDAFDY